MVRTGGSYAKCRSLGYQSVGTTERSYKVLPQLRIPMMRTELLIFSSGLLAVQSSWILPAGLLLAYPVPVVGDWVGEAIKLSRPSTSGSSYKLEECCCQFCVALKPLSLHWVS